MRDASKELFQPYSDIAVDERIVASRHKFSGIRQFIKDKPIRFGLKLWVVADTKTGYTYDFFVYLGKKRTEIVDRVKGLAYNVVFTLLQSLLNQGYRIFVDSFYTTLSLATDLLKQSSYLIGAVKKNSSAMPQRFKDVDRWEKAAQRGDFRWHRENNFVAVQWKDCKTVTIISPIHKGSEVTTCSRTVQQRLGMKKTTVSQPLLINNYNFGMLAVDKSNQYLTQYPCYIKTKFHWWKVLFFHCLDIMIVNACVVYRIFHSQPKEHQTSQLEFREALVKAIIREYGQQETAKRKKCFPQWDEKRTDCAYCRREGGDRVKTYITCSGCNVGLCLNKDRNCFYKWHQ